MKALYLLGFLACIPAYANDYVWEEKNLNEQQLIEKGRHIVKIGACNDCHTPTFPEKEGNVPEKEWLVGSPVGFKGPWGVSYPSNLRKLVSTMKEGPFMNYVRSKKYTPPMPGYAVKTMTDTELKALYVYIRHLGAAENRVPASLPPGEKVAGPYINFVPVSDK